MIVVGVSYCVLIVFFPFCDARYKRYLGDIGKDLLEMNRSLFLWSLRRSPGTLCWKQASYFTELAFIYIYFDHLMYSKVVIMFWKPFYKRYENYLDTIYGGIGWKILFQTIGWEKYGLSQLLFFSTRMNVTCRIVGMEVEKWWLMMFMKNAHCVLVLWRPADNLCDHIYPNMGTGVVI